MRLRLLLIATLLLSAAQGHAQPQDEHGRQQAQAHQAYLQRVAGALSRERGARELALAALLRAAGTQADASSAATAPDPQAQAWLKTAAARPDAGLPVLRLLTAAAAPDDGLRPAAARRWQAAEPGNLMPLLHAGLDIDALLAQARTASRADGGMYEDVRWIAATLRRHPPDAAEQAAMTGGQEFHGDEAAAVAAMGLWAASATPDYAALVEGCGQATLRALPARGEDCRRVAVLLAEHSTSLAGEHAGLAMLRALASTAAERDAVDARQRGMDWRMLQWGRLARQQPRDGAAQFARLLADATIDSEQQLVERVLAEGGVAPEPPPGWVPPRR
ncbi:hypothetical protein [Luteimonas sp. SDU82]|uniref:hypothetical protein n=1 Tax=Luteimonas sp. SDU82 TaxID=3422592 RepID=UPI003EB86FEA